MDQRWGSMVQQNGKAPKLESEEATLKDWSQDVNMPHASAKLRAFFYFPLQEKSRCEREDSILMISKLK
jgi:hypothetical protein